MNTSGRGRKEGFEFVRVISTKWSPQKIERHHFIGKNYVPTLNAWAEALEANKEKAIELKGQEMYDIWQRYLTGCSDLFRDGYTNVCQFTLVK